MASTAQKVVHEYLVHYPELMVPVVSRSGERAINEITTDFSPRTQIR